MKYAILIYETPEQFAARTDQAREAAYWAGYRAYSAMLGGAISQGAALTGPETATTVRLRGGRRAVTDGPFADTKEQLGGFFIVEAQSLDQALDWAAQAPNVGEACVEVRPLMAM